MTKLQIEKSQASIEDIVISWSYFPPENSCSNKKHFDNNITINVYH